jgi:catechol 2,3-dioxygenase-like lactoylglutathione lyase family enzyme
MSVKRTQEGDMALQLTTVMLGVEDLDRAKAFYSEGLGCRIKQDYPQFVELDLGDGSSSLALYPRDAVAADAGVPGEGSGFRGVSFHHIVSGPEAVDDLIGKAEAAGATVVRKAEGAQWGYFGYFSDPDGHLWKVASA